MKYRWKLLLLLLVISIAPMAAARYFGVHTLNRLGNELISQNQEELVAGMKDRLRVLVDMYSQIIWNGRERVEMALMVQAEKVERLLAGPSSVSKNVFFSRDFRGGIESPSDIRPSMLHFRLDQNGGQRLLSVSYSAQVFKTAPGVQPNHVMSDILRLSSLTPTYRNIARRFQGIVLWQYTILDNGVISTFPGHGAGSGKLDVRKPYWYGTGSERPAPWTDPYIDPVTRQLVMAAVMPVSRPEGENAGLTAVVVPISRLLNQRQLVQNIPQESSAFLCYLALNPETGRRGARIFARQDYTGAQNRSWHSNLGTDWLVSADEKSLQAVMDDIQVGAGNIRRMSYRGCECFWSYGPIHGDAFLVVITPSSVVHQPVKQAEENVQSLIGDVVSITGYVGTGIVLLVVVLAFSFSRTVTRPLQALVDGAMKLSKGHFDTRVDIRSKDEFGEMGRVFNYVVPRMEEHYRMSRSIALAREVQRNLIPSGNPAIDGLDVAGITLTCEETGGDYYDFLDLENRGTGRFGVVVGDVSGHGLPSALLMASVRAFLRQRVAMQGDMSDIVSDVNRQLSRDVEESGRFMTLFYCEFDTTGQQLKWVRAGHEPCLSYTPDTDDFEILSGRGISLGIDETAVFEESSRPVFPGQVVFLGTDGIWETYDTQGNMFGKSRLKKIIRDTADQPAESMVKAVVSAVEAFRGEAVQEDDITLVVVKVTALDQTEKKG